MAWTIKEGTVHLLVDFMIRRLINGAGLTQIISIVRVAAVVVKRRVLGKNSGATAQISLRIITFPTTTTESVAQMTVTNVRSPITKIKYATKNT